MVYLYKGILLGNKKESTTNKHNNIEEFPNNYAKWKNPDTEYLFDHSTYQKKKNLSIENKSVATEKKDQ